LVASEESLSVFTVRRTPATKPGMGIELLPLFLTFKEPVPNRHLFLLKQLGRFEIPCRVCHVPFVASGHAGHKIAHKSKAEKKKLKKPFLLPNVCRCQVSWASAWELYSHVLANHGSELFV
jgi:hypothetical protein